MLANNRVLILFGMVPNDQCARPPWSLCSDHLFERGRLEGVAEDKGKKQKVNIDTILYPPHDGNALVDFPN